tara:strand:+ start:3407 stop:4279 length:873 start_codon:yes stop_codon:yes gene_type:complete
MYKINYWIKAARPQTLIASLVPIIPISILCINLNKFSVSIFICTLLCSIFIQIMTNFINDLYDFKKGSDRSDRVGPERVIERGYLNEREILRGVYFLLFLSVILGLYLVKIGGVIILLIGLSSFLFAYLYTATKFSIAYNGLGEVFVFIYFGILASWGTFYLQTLTYNFFIILFGIIGGSLNSSMLIINNLRDYSEDLLSNKKTLIVVFGKNFGKIEFLLMNILSYISLYYLLLSLNKMHILNLFCPLVILSIIISYKVLIDAEFIKRALPYYSFYIMLFTAILSIVIAL